MDIPTPSALRSQRVDIYCKVLISKLVLRKPMYVRWNQYKGQVAGEPAAPTTEEMTLIVELFNNAGWWACFHYHNSPFGDGNFVTIKEPTV